MKNFSMIAAVALNGIIGDSVTNSMPWHLPADLKHFKQRTIDKTVVMGSRTYESIGRPLPKRRNVVITRGDPTSLLNAGVAAVYQKFEDAFKEEGDFVVIGGAYVYTEAMKFSPSVLDVTIVRIEADGDVRFPIEGRRFVYDDVTMSNGLSYKCTDRSEWQDDGGVQFQFATFTRK